MGQAEVLALKGKFTACQKILTVFGDEVRQRLLLLMLEGNPNGVRVADISGKMKLTPPAVSHHMQILKDAGVVHCRKEGKYMYYFLDSSGKDIDQLLELFAQMKEMLARR